MAPLLLAAILFHAQIGATQDSAMYPDVPDNHWAYDTLKRFKSEGFLPEMNDGRIIGNRPHTRYEIAGYVVHAAMNLDSRIGYDDPNMSFEDRSNPVRLAAARLAY